VNIRQPIFVLAANKSICDNDFMQIRGALKSFELQYTGQKIFIVCMSVKGIFLAYSCEHSVEVTSL